MKNSTPLAQGAGTPGQPGGGVRPTIRIPKTAELVADQFRRRIIRGELKEGDFLPPEGQLMAELGISRPTLRESFRILEAESLIGVMRGSRTGARVYRPHIDGVTRYAGFVLQADGTTVSDLYEARLAIEPFVARRLAVQKSPEVVARLNAEIETLTALVDAGQYIDFMIGLTNFHRVLVELGENRTLLFMTRLLQGVLARHQVEYFQRRSLDPVVQRRRSMWGLRSFRKLVELIETGDADGAEAHWRLHVGNANAYWAEGAEGQAPIELLD